ncbi:unnamed protein product [Gongylonema pulchrum]|uniref:SLC12 domain-containing protein n=1 Tax=Gongylonema pulchrum TaxID=637853 RepID=A0A183EED2_9BILA|nr:unnamed protein product [Gongylonema pulchrum]
MVPLDDIALVILTSGLPSHVGNLNLFLDKPLLFHTMEYMGQHATITELKDRPYRKLTENVEVWKTPGRTQQCLSVLTESQGSVDDSVWDPILRRQNANLIVCLVDWIIPGHGQPFRVLPRYR